MCNEKWIPYNNVEQKGSLGKQNEPPHQRPSSPKEGDVVYMVGLESSPLLRTLSRKPNN